MVKVRLSAAGLLAIVVGCGGGSAATDAGAGGGPAGAGGGAAGAAGTTAAGGAGGAAGAAGGAAGAAGGAAGGAGGAAGGAGGAAGGGAAGGRGGSAGRGGSGGGAGGSTGIRKQVLPGLDVECQGVSGLTGQAILNQRVDRMITTLSYTTAQGTRVDPTALTIDMTWPASPVATCYEPYFENGVMYASARVAIEGLTMHFQTADGKFDETLPAKAWFPVVGGAPQFPQMLAVTVRSNLRGTWQPMPVHANAGDTIHFLTRLDGAFPNLGQGNVAVSGTPPDQIDAAIFKGAFAVATW